MLKARQRLRLGQSLKVEIRNAAEASQLQSQVVRRELLAYYYKQNIRNRDYESARWLGHVEQSKESRDLIAMKL